MRSKDSDRKWVLFVLCGTRCFIKPVYVADILLQGPWAAGKHIHKYGDTTWRDNKSYVMMLLLTGSAPPTKKTETRQNTKRYASMSKYIRTQFIISTNVYFPLCFPFCVPSDSETVREGPVFRASLPGAPHPGGALISTTAGMLHTWDTSLFCGCKVLWQGGCRVWRQGGHNRQNLKNNTSGGSYLAHDECSSSQSSI